MGPSCPLGISHFGPARKRSLFGYVINPLLPKLDRSRWLEVYWPRSLIFCVFIDLHFFSAINMQKRTWPIFSHLGVVFGQQGSICIDSIKEVLRKARSFLSVNSLQKTFLKKNREFLPFDVQK